MHRNKTNSERKIEHTSKGIVSQMKGHLKEAWGELTDNPKAKLSGKVDRVKGRVQEEYGRSIKDDDDTQPM